jgi:hypothetical protein
MGRAKEIDRASISLGRVVMAVPQIVISPNVSGAQVCPCEKTVRFFVSGSASAMNPDTAELEARAQMNDAISEMDIFIGNWIRGLSCQGSCRLIELIIDPPKGNLDPPGKVVRNKDDGSISWGLKHLVFGRGEVITYLCSWSVSARHAVLCIPAQRPAG